MKYIALLFTGLLLAGVALTDGHAQLSKKEKKEWKKKAKQLVKNPEQYKALLDENASLKSQVSAANRQIQDLEAQLRQKNEQIDEMQNRLRSVQSDLMNARRELEAKEEAGPGPMNMNGIVFKVQIGAFRDKDLSKYFDKVELFSGGETVDGLQAITLGYFRDYWQADAFKKYLREMGVKDAWIVPFRDGQRVPLREVLEEVSQSQG